MRHETRRNAISDDVQQSIVSDLLPATQLKGTQGVRSKQPVRTATQQALFSRVAAAWAAAKGWPIGKWPRNRSYDALLIGRWICKLGMPFEFWASVIERTPTSAAFTWLTQPPQPGRVCRLEEWAINDLRQREHRRQVIKGDGPLNAEGQRAIAAVIDELRSRMRVFDEDYGRD